MAFLIKLPSKVFDAIKENEYLVHFLLQLLYKHVKHSLTMDYSEGRVCLCPKVVEGVLVRHSVVVVFCFEIVTSLNYRSLQSKTKICSILSLHMYLYLTAMCLSV